MGYLSLVWATESFNQEVIFDKYQKSPSLLAFHHDVLPTKICNS